MSKDEALKLAMEAMEITGGFDVEILAIKEAFAQPEPWEKFCDSNCVWTDHHPDCKLAERTWVCLTNDEIDQGLLRSDYAFKTAEAWRAGVVFAMTKLKEKNT